MSDQLIALALVLVSGVILLFYGLRHRGKLPALYPHPMFQALGSEVGRVAEEGRDIHIALGKSGIAGSEAMTSVAALRDLNTLVDLAASYDTPPVITTGDPTLYLLAQNRLRKAYSHLGNAAAFRLQSVQFVAPSPLTYAAMAATMLYDNQIGSNITLGGFDQEVTLLTDAAYRQGVQCYGGAVSTQGLAALYPSLGSTELAMGEEVFTGGAAVEQRNSLQGSLQAQDVLRALVILGMIGAAVLSLLGLGG